MPLLLPLLLAQLAAAQPPAALPPPDSGYATAALQRFVERAAEANRRVPAALRGYTAQVESEVAVVARRDGADITVGVEQMASRLTWSRGGDYEQRVVGYRARLSGFTVSMLSMLDDGWIVPSLYGNRLALIFGRDTTRRARRDGRRDPVLAVHPFAADRDSVYRFGGGDTVATLRVNGRAIPVVRVLVEPRAVLPARTFVFRGEVDVDAARHQIVRLRGQFLVSGGRPPWRTRLARSVLQAFAFVELESQEVAGRYWLPARQRLELEGGLRIGGEERGVVRIVSRVHDIAIDENAALAAAAMRCDTLACASPEDTLVPGPHTLVVASGDTLAAFTDWRAPLGRATAEVDARRFDDLRHPPGSASDRGVPRPSPYVERLSDLFHYDRVEGAYTGAGVRWRDRDDGGEPGVTVTAVGGWAWSEQVVRGRASVQLPRGRWRYSLSAGRTLDLTNDFRTVFDSGSTISALLGEDDYDYVDRRWAALGATGPLGRNANLRLSTGPAQDRITVATVAHAPLRRADEFRPNRGVLPGNYWRSRAVLELQPSVRAGFVRPGAGGELRYERGDGELAYQRAEVRAELRRDVGPATVAARGNAGVVTGNPIPPQQLFELGGDRQLPGYAYKEFAGDRAATLGVMTAYALPLWRAPLRVRVPFWRRLYLPAPAPALSAAISGGWVGASSPAARAAIVALGGRTDSLGAFTPFSRPTDGVRASVELGLRFFGESIFVGAARPLDGGERWRFVLGSVF